MATPTLFDHAVLALLWLGYFATHSLLASLRAKTWMAQRWPVISRRYRLWFNVVAVALILPPAIVMHTIPTASLWTWTNGAAVVANGLALAALAAFFWSLRFYNSGEFLGTAPPTNQPARFVLSPLHGVVRHPWYSLALIIIWTRDMNSAFCVSALLFTLYFYVGSIWEERKLCIEFGAAYREYQSRVARLIPWPGKILNAAERQTLEESAVVHVAQQSARRQP